MIIRQKHLSSNENIFITIADLEDEFQANSVVSVIFNHDIKFPQPIFLITLLDLQSKYSKKLVIDIIDLDSYEKDNRQYYFHWFLDLYRRLEFIYSRPKYVKTKTKSGKFYINKNEDDVASIFKLDAEKRQIEYDRLFSSEIRTQENIFYFYSKNPPENLNFEIDETNHMYGFMPIFKLTNLYFDSKSIHTATSSINNPADSTLNLPSGHEDTIKNISLDIPNEEIDLRFRINKVLGVIYKNPDLISTVIYEILDNIRQHTKHKKENETVERLANAYISFHNNTSKKNIYEFIIADTYEVGFLETYFITLQNELSNLERDAKEIDVSISKDFSEVYQRDIEKLDLSIKLEEPYHIREEEVLRGLFDPQSTSSTHQMKRIIMHFGIPSLVRVVSKYKLEGKKASIDIYVHRENRFYHINYDGANTSVNYLGNQGAKGTYYHISLDNTFFPQDENILSEIQLSKKDYIQAFENKNNFTNTLEKFRNPLEDPRSPDGRPRKFSFMQFMKKKEILYSKADDFTVGHFMREVFKYAFLHDTKDIIIVDFPIDLLKNYLFTIIKILYANNDDQDSEVRPDARNILFYDDKSMNVFFLGGETLEELCLMNKIISNHYTQDLAMGLQLLCPQLKQTNESNVNLFNLEKPVLDTSFYNSEEGVLPLSRADFISTLDSKLEENKIKDIHFDTGFGYHVDGFYRFENIFVSSVMASRIAKELTVDIKTKFKNEKNIILVGTDKYTSLVLAYTEDFIKIAFKDSQVKVLVLDDFSKHNIKKLEDICTDDEYKDYAYVIYSPVVFTGKSIESKVINIISKEEKIDNYEWFATVKINTDDKINKNLTYLLSKNLVDTNGDPLYYKVGRDHQCSICTGDNERVLHEMDPVNSYQIKNFYYGDYREKELKSAREANTLRWENSIFFVHATRGSSHYTYYAKTLEFFEDNKLDISQYLEKNLHNELYREKENIIILSPQHNTNNSFVRLVNKKVFNDEASIHQFDSSKAEENLYNINIEIPKSKETSIYFVDDVLSSGSTLEYFYSLLKSIPNIDMSAMNFKGAIVMIDRTASYDEKVFSNYFASNTKRLLAKLKKIKFTNIPKVLTMQDFQYQRVEFCKKSKLENVYSFTKLEIKPIKTIQEYKDCFLCIRQKEYMKYLDSCVLDMNKFQAAKHAVNLKAKDYNEIDRTKYNQKKLSKKIRNIIKVMAVDYIFSKYSDYFDNVHNNTFEKLEDDFYKYAYKLTIPIISKYFNDTDDYNRLDNIFKKIIQHESDVALLKALTFPKLVYYHKIRDVATEIIIKRIRANRKLLSAESIKGFIDEGERQQIADEALTEEINEFFKTYIAKTNFAYINFLYRVAGYLNITEILKEENIQFFANTTIKHKEMKKKEKDKDDENKLPFIKTNKEEFEGDGENILLSSYPFAVKMVSSYSEDKSSFLYQQLESLRDTIGTDEFSLAKYTLVHALIIENNITIMKNYKKKEVDIEVNKILDSNSSIDDKIEKFSDKIENFVNKEFESINGIESFTKIEHIYINENLNIKYDLNDKTDTYKEYIDNSNLRDVLHGFNELSVQNDTNIKMLYRGAVAREDTEKIEPKDIEELHRIDITWANMYIDKYKFKDNENSCTIIRLVEIDTRVLESKNSLDVSSQDKSVNNPIWLKPIGCIIFSHNGDHQEHLVLSKIALAIQNEIVYFFKKEFSHETFKETIQRTDFSNAMSIYNHTTGDMLDVASMINSAWSKLLENHKYNEKFILENYKDFDDIRDYMYGVLKIGRIGHLKRMEFEDKTTNIYDLLISENNNIMSFFNIARKMLLINPNIEIKIDDTLKKVNLPINEEATSIILFELFFNAAKYNNLQKYETCIINIGSKNSNCFFVSNTRVKGGEIKGMGLKSAKFYLTEFLKKINYSFEPIENLDNEYIIKIRKK